MSGHEWAEQVPAFVLQALEPEEQAAFASHLEECAECRQAVREYREVATHLAGQVERSEPPPELRARVLAAVAPRADVIELKKRRAVVSRLAWLSAAAGIFAVWAGVAASRTASENESLSTELAGARSQIAALQGERSRRDSMLAVLAGGGVRSATLTTTGQDPQIRLFANAEQGLLLVTAFALPPAPTGRTYQLWGIADGEDPVSLGLFETDEGGTAILLRDLPPGANYAVSAVTDEPAGGSPQPTTQPFLIGTWVGDD